VAPRALVECRPAVGVADGATVAAVQALDLPKTNFHEVGIGVRDAPDLPRTGDA